MVFYSKPRFHLVSPESLEGGLAPMKIAPLHRPFQGHRRLVCIPSENTGKVDICLSASICDKLKVDKDLTWLFMLVATVFNLGHAVIWQGESTVLRVSSLALGIGGWIYAYSSYKTADIWSRWCFSPRFRTISRTLTTHHTPGRITALQIMTTLLYALEFSFSVLSGLKTLDSWLGYPWTRRRAMLYALLTVIFLMAHDRDIRILYLAKDIDNKDGQPYGSQTAQKMLCDRVMAMHLWVLETIKDDAWDALEIGDMHIMPIENFVQLQYNGHAGVDFGLMGLLQVGADEITLCLSEGAPLDFDVVEEALADGVLEEDPNRNILLGKTTCGKKMAKKYGADPKDWHSLSVGDSRWRILARAARKVYVMRD